ncbi:MAG TPA: dTDP-4-dehydrorhamnose 3,5-epimerase [bacterium]|nr:dTDP-4-dehydrorhamnose 3,5-epimerase [bacterium]
MPFRFTPLEIAGLVLVEAERFEDRRGFLKETYRRSTFEAAGIAAVFVQDNVSRSGQHVLRGLHYQASPRAQAKLVGVVRGEIFDVAVDLRHGSATYGRWVGVTLSDRNHRMLFVPAGFAHGFCVLSTEADVHYKTSDEYSPEHERGVIWSDPKIGVHWPVKNPIVSARDVALPPLSGLGDDFPGIEVPR